VTPRSVVLRESAHQDIVEAIGFYVGQGAQNAALTFVDELERALDHISRHPDAGSPRYAHELGLPGVRSWTLQTYPYLIFYVIGEDRIDVWRVLHGERDIPSWMRQ
jgi:toxin ParE1/3/4